MRRYDLRPLPKYDNLMACSIHYSLDRVARHLISFLFIYNISNKFPQPRQIFAPIFFAFPFLFLAIFFFSAIRNFYYPPTLSNTPWNNCYCVLVRRLVKSCWWRQLLKCGEFSMMGSLLRFPFPPSRFPFFDFLNFRVRKSIFKNIYTYGLYKVRLTSLTNLFFLIY